MRPRFCSVFPSLSSPASLLGHPFDTKPSFEAFEDRLIRNFSGLHVPKAEHPESLTLDVVLSPLEAQNGTSISVEVPQFRACEDCGGSGSVPPFHCGRCGGSGQVEEIRELKIEVPPGVRPGTVIEAPLDLLGIGNLYIRAQISISSLSSLEVPDYSRPA